MTPQPVRDTRAEAIRAARLLADAEAAFRDVLAESLETLELCDRNLLLFHHFHGLTLDQVGELCCRPRTAVARQLGRIRERLLRDIRRGLAARLARDRAALEPLLELARRRLDLAITRVLRG